MLLDIFHFQGKLRIHWHVFEYSSRKCYGKISSNLNDDENRPRKNWLEKKIILIPKTYSLKYMDRTGRPD